VGPLQMKMELVRLELTTPCLVLLGLVKLEIVE
jgi:hypothetical protein